MRTSLSVTLLILGAFLLMSPELLPLFASAGDVKMPLLDGMGRVVVPSVGIVMIVLGIVAPMMGRSKSEQEAGRHA